MNIYCKFWLAAFFYGVIGLANLALAETEIQPSLANAQCQAATYGTLNLKKLPDDPNVVATLILCGLRDVIFEPTTNQKQVVDKINNKKIRIVDALLEKKWRTNARDEFGNTILMAMVMSYLPTEWRAKKIAWLLNNGSDLHAQNSAGKTALALAQLRGEKTVIAALTGS